MWDLCQSMVQNERTWWLDRERRHAIDSGAVRVSGTGASYKRTIGRRCICPAHINGHASHLLWGLAQSPHINTCLQPQNRNSSASQAGMWHTNWFSISNSSASAHAPKVGTAAADHAVDPCWFTLQPNKVAAAANLPPATTDVTTMAVANTKPAGARAAAKSRRLFPVGFQYVLTCQCVPAALH
jgi:hypothetical protein